MVQIITLDGLPLQTVAEVFNLAFADYKISFRFTEETFRSKIVAENIQLSWSPGAIINNQLAGFILAATDTFSGIPMVYNAGTGVLPAHRRSGIGRQLYQQLVQHTADQGFHYHLLEVFADNTKAIALYEAMGFGVKRKLDCYKGRMKQHTDDISAVKPLTLNPSLFQSFWDVQPSWQNNLPAVARVPGEHNIIGIDSGDTTIAYAIYHPKNARIKQIAVHRDYRRKGLGKMLMEYIRTDLQDRQVTVTCVEDNTALDGFLQAVGLQPFLPMLEMEMEMEVTQA